MLINQLIEGFVSAKRVKTFLDGDELQPNAREIILNSNICAGDVVCSGELLCVRVSSNTVLGVRHQGWRIRLV